MNTLAAAQDVPAFRFRSAQLRPLDPLPRSSQTIAALPPVIVRTARVRGDERERTAFLRRQRLQSLAAAEPSGTFTLRTTDDAAILAALSLGFQVRLLASDNVNSAIPAFALADTVLDFTPIARFTAGGVPGLQAEDSRDPELYLDALYAPTSHRLLRAGQSVFLHHVIAQAGRATAVAHAGARLIYDENSFSAGSDSAAEETFTLLEIEPVIEYRTSVRTTAHLRAVWRRITLDQADGNRTEGGIDAGIEYEISPKTLVGTGIEAGHIRFDREDFGTQDYRQGYVSMTWKATPKITFRTRTGVEWRGFRRLNAPPEKTGVATSTRIEWRATESTRVAASFSIRDQPSVTESGSLFRETRGGFEAEHELGGGFYARCEVDYAVRAYDSGRRESEINVQPAAGYRLLAGALCDSVRVEAFWQFRRHWNRDAAGYDRKQCGIQLAALF